VMLLSLTLDGRPVAQKCNLMAPEGAFAFKIAFDEGFASCSPGLLLEIENIRRLHQSPRIRWMDSCAVTNHFMINRLWNERRTIETLLVSTGRLPGNLAIWSLPLLKRVNRLRLRVSGTRILTSDSKGPIVPEAKIAGLSGRPQRQEEESA
jgi:Acetyltransferase (GNAT) domain